MSQQFLGLMRRSHDWARPLLLAPIALIVAGCTQVGTQNVTFWDIVWSITIFVFWLIYIWMFIVIFTDVVRRDDVSGWGKAGWILFILILPFLGILLYIAFRPRDLGFGSMNTGVSAGPTKPPAPTWPADDTERLASLRASGAITEAEYQQLKAAKVSS